MKWEKFRENQAFDPGKNSQNQPPERFKQGAIRSAGGLEGAEQFVHKLIGLHV